MKKRFEKLISIVLVLSFLISPIGYSLPEKSSLKLDGTQSRWAEKEIIEAYDYNLTYPDVMNNFKKNITREEFCVIAVKLYAALTLEKPQPAKNPFTDTKNPEILKAYNLGIVKGISSDKFAPDNYITRQEICVMIYRTLDKAIAELDMDTSGDFPFDDASKIASWALKEMKFAYKNQIMKGIGNNLLGPLQNTSREQAIVLLKRTYENFSDTDENLDLNLDENLDVDLGTINTFTPKLIVTTEEIKYKERDENNLFFPKYDKKLLLDDSSYTVFVDKENPKYWFSYTLKEPSTTKKIIWQVSKSPYVGYDTNWRSPLGLVASDEISPSSGKFLVDFDNLKISSSGMQISLVKPITLSSQPIKEKQKIYYVRAVALDISNKPIGDPGDGIAVTFGEKVINDNPQEEISSDFELWTPRSSQGNYQGEFRDLPDLKTTVGIDPRNNESRLFHFNDIGSIFDKLVIQISTKAFPKEGSGYPDTPDIIYEKEYPSPIDTLYNYPNSVYLDFAKFAKPSSEMKEGEYIKYYLRGLVIKDSINPGIYDVTYSQPITIEYGYAPPIKWYSDSPYNKFVDLEVSKPNLKIKNYTPVKWESKEYLYHYYVYRQPKANEITSKWKNSQTGDILYPYIFHEAYYASQGINNISDYENKAIPKVLTVGTKVYFPPPKEESKSWYEQLYDGIVEFFKDVVSIVKDIANQVSSAYNNLKKNLVAYVVNLCPIESLKGPFKIALEGLVDYGMMSMGIPPTLPNFDELSDMSLDYMAEIALTEAGIPADEMTKDLVKDVAGAIGDEIEKSTNYADSNPIDSPFLKLDPDYLYRPAYVDVEISNYTNVASITGTFDLNVTFEMDYYNKLNPINGLFLEAPTNYSYNSDAGLIEVTNYRNHFEYGLNNDSVDYSQGEVAVYDVFNPVKGVKVPKLNPGETTTLRVYLNPYQGSRFSRYPDGEHVLPIDFENMYFNNGNKKFTHFKLFGRFMSAEEYLIENSNMFYLDPKTKYYYTKEAYHEGGEILQKPVAQKWTK